MDTDATQTDAVETVPVWRDTAAPVDTRVEALVEAMTLDALRAMHRDKDLPRSAKS